jgi:hypothetical protein
VPLTNTQIRYYDSNVLRLPADKRKEYDEQVDRQTVAEVDPALADADPAAAGHARDAIVIEVFRIRRLPGR